MSRFRKDIAALDRALAESDPAEWHRRRVAAATRRMPEAMRGVMGRYGMEAVPPGEVSDRGQQNPNDGRYAFDVVIRAPDFMATYMSRVQKLTRFYPDEATARADAARLIDREFPGGALISVKRSARDPRVHP